MKLLRDIIKQKSTKVGPATDRDEDFVEKVIQRSEPGEKAETKKQATPTGAAEHESDEVSLPGFLKPEGQADIPVETSIKDDGVAVESSDAAVIERKPAISEPIRTDQPDGLTQQVNKNTVSRPPAEEAVEKIASESDVSERAEQQTKVVSRLLPDSKPDDRPEPGVEFASAPLQLTKDQLAHDPVEIPVAIEVPPPAAGRNKNRAGRAKTRLLGFNTGSEVADNPFAKRANTQEAVHTNFPVGWLVVTDGPGHGAGFTLYGGVAQIGRGEGQTVRLDFGDNSISRENHAAIAYDAEQNTFFIGHGGKANLVRCNDMPVLSTQALEAGDQIRIGETTLRFVPLCGPDFQWQEQLSDETPYAQRG